MIRAYVGKLGEGKTFGMVADAVGKFSRELCQVYTDMRSLRFPEAIYIDIDRIEMMTQVRSGLILLDEAQLAMSSRFWQKIDKGTLAALAQLRKNGLDLWYTTQDINRVDSVLRELTNEQIQCRRMFGYIFRMKKEPGEEKRVRLPQPVRINPEYFCLYDTLEVLGSHHGDLIRGSTALAAARAKRSDGREAARRQTLRERVMCWKTWDGETYRMTREAQEAAAWLAERGALGPPGALRNARVMAEVRRRRWLRMFGLKADEVPIDCTYENPWVRGYGPDDEFWQSASDSDFAEGGLAKSGKARSKRERNPEAVTKSVHEVKGCRGTLNGQDLVSQPV